MRERCVIGNWKLNGSLATNALLLSALKDSVSKKPGGSCGVCVPALYLPQVQQTLSGSTIGWGSQDVSRMEAGAYTGAISAVMVSAFGARYTLVGPSERRAIFRETDASVVG